MELSPRDIRVRPDGLNLHAPDASDRLSKMLAENAKKITAINSPQVGQFLDDVWDLDSIGGIPGREADLQKHGQNPILLHAVYVEARDAVRTRNLPQLQRNLRLAKDLGLNLASTDTRRQGIADALNKWDSEYGAAPPETEEDLSRLSLAQLKDRAESLTGTQLANLPPYKVYRLIEENAVTVGQLLTMPEYPQYLLEAMADKAENPLIPDEELPNHLELPMVAVAAFREFYKVIAAGYPALASSHAQDAFDEFNETFDKQWESYNKASGRPVIGAMGVKPPPVNLVQVQEKGVMLSYFTHAISGYDRQLSLHELSSMEDELVETGSITATHPSEDETRRILALLPTDAFIPLSEHFAPGQNPGEELIANPDGIRLLVSDIVSGVRPETREEDIKTLVYILTKGIDPEAGTTEEQQQLIENARLEIFSSLRPYTLEDAVPAQRIEASQLLNDSSFMNAYVALLKRDTSLIPANPDEVVNPRRTAEGTRFRIAQILAVFARERVFFLLENNPAIVEALEYTSHLPEYDSHFGRFERGDARKAAQETLTLFRAEQAGPLFTQEDIQAMPEDQGRVAVLVNWLRRGYLEDKTGYLDTDEGERLQDQILVSLGLSLAELGSPRVKVLGEAIRKASRNYVYIPTLFERDPDKYIPLINQFLASRPNLQAAFRTIVDSGAVGRNHATVIFNSAILKEAGYDEVKEDKILQDYYDKKDFLKKLLEGERGISLDDLTAAFVAERTALIEHEKSYLWMMESQSRLYQTLADQADPQLATVNRDIVSREEGERLNAKNDVEEMVRNIAQQTDRSEEDILKEFEARLRGGT